MSEREEQRAPARALGEMVFGIAMLGAIMLGVREGFALLIPADSCAGKPVEAWNLVLGFGFMFHFADPKNKTGYARHLRLGATLLTGLIVALPAARLAAGCAPPAAWGEEARFAIEALVMFGILIPLGHLHRDVIESRWARAMGENGVPAGEEPPA